MSAPTVKYLSEPEAWAEIARRMERRGLGYDGLCAEVYRAKLDFSFLYDEPRLVSDATAALMLLRIKRHLPFLRIYLAPRFEVAPRIAYALRFADESRRVHASRANPNLFERVWWFAKSALSAPGARPRDAGADV